MTFLRRALPVFFLLAVAARADLVWTPETGWRAEGGLLAPLIAPEGGGRNALDLLNRATAAEEKGDKSGALSLYENVAKKYPRSELAGEALFHAGQLRLDRQQYFKAFDRYQEIVTLHPDTDHFNQIIGQQYAISTALIGGARNHWFGLIPSPFRSRSEGVDYAEKILRNAPHSDYAPLALMKIAQGQQLAGNLDNAKDALDRLISNYPQSVLAPDAYLRLAQAYADDVQGPSYDQGATKQAITYYEDFTLQFPKDPNVPSAAKGLADMRTVLAQGKVEIGDFYLRKRDNFTAARVLYNEAITTYPDSAVATLARQRLAEVDAAEAKFKQHGPRKKFLGIF
jgi:outer membrane protein assembly factor BamD